MHNLLKIQNNGNTLTIDVEGVIGAPEEWQFENPSGQVATYEKFKELTAPFKNMDGLKIIVNIRSTGGDVNDALLIHDELKTLSSDITTRCYGYVASAATIIAQSASEGKRYISENSLYLIHQALANMEGNKSQLRGTLDLLAITDSILANIYHKRSGRSVDEFNALMAENDGNGRWLSASETIELGLADGVIDGTPITSNEIRMVRASGLPDIKNVKLKSKEMPEGTARRVIDSIAKALGVPVTNFFPSVKNYDYTDKEGKVLLSTPEGEDQVLKVGDSVTLPSGEKSGTFIIEQNDTDVKVVIVDEVVTEILDVEDTTNSAEVDQLPNGGYTDASQ